MTTLLGARCDERKTCGAQHLPGCYNPNSDDTYCICGAVRWRGQVGTWHSRAVREIIPGESPRPTSRIIGWDVYFLHATGCTASRPHVCGGSKPIATAVQTLDFTGGAA